MVSKPTTSENAASPPGSAEPAGLYIHIPFCVRKCPYCDFYSITDTTLRSELTGALLKETRLAAAPDRPVVDTIHFGGGTPSLMTADQIAALLAAANESFTVSPDAEITVEANPDSITGQWLEAIRQAGVNRLNIGVQSLDDTELAFLGRVHDAEQARTAAVAARRHGFTNIGLDIIYGLPGQTKAGLSRTLSRALELEPAHLSCYLLTCEPGTPLEKSLNRGGWTPLPEDVAAELFLFIISFLRNNDFLQYEISNFSRHRQTRSRHNQKYWRRRPYFGLGPAAHSYDGRQRSWNVNHLERYLEELAADRRPRAAFEILTRRQKMTEAVYLGLRLTEGINLNAFEDEFGIDLKQLPATVPDYFHNQGLLEISADHCRLTTRGMLFHESAAAALIELL
ncbi:MAG: radical SAM family heme chaperone HemW [Desulfosudaceae bacterium]